MTNYGKIECHCLSFLLKMKRCLPVTQEFEGLFSFGNFSTPLKDLFLMIFPLIIAELKL